MTQFHLDTDTLKLHILGREIELRGNTYWLLHSLWITHPRWKSADTLIRELYGWSEPRQPERDLRVVVHRANKLIEERTGKRLVENLHGDGYRLNIHNKPVASGSRGFRRIPPNVGSWLMEPRCPRLGMFDEA